MAALTVQSVPGGVGVIAPTPVQLSAWASPDTIAADLLGDRGVIAEVDNDSGGPLDVRVSDAGRTPAGSAAANGYITTTVADGESARVFVGKNNVNPATNVASIGASATNAAFTVRLTRY